MGIWQIIVGSVVLILSVLMIIVIILQEGHDAGLGTITGGAGAFTKRGKAKTADAMFAKVTKFCAILFFVFVVVLNALSYFGLTGKPKADKTDEVIQSTVSDVSTEGSVQPDEEASAQESAQSAEETSAQASTEASKEESAQASTEASKEESAQASTEASKEESAQASTEVSKEESAQASAEESKAVTSAAE